MTSETFPAPETAKAQAKRLRAHLAQAGVTLGHSEALEAIAALHGARDWNTLAAAAPRPNAPVPPLPAVGEVVRGTYLKRSFSGVVTEVKALSGGVYRLGLRFDEPIDVVDSALFSNFRQNVRVQVTEDGISCDHTGSPTRQFRLAR